MEMKQTRRAEVDDLDSGEATRKWVLFSCQLPWQRYSAGRERRCRVSGPVRGALTGAAKSLRHTVLQSSGDFSPTQGGECDGKAGELISDHLPYPTPPKLDKRKARFS